MVLRRFPLGRLRRRLSFWRNRGTLHRRHHLARLEVLLGLGVRLKSDEPQGRGADRRGARRARASLGGGRRAVGLGPRRTGRAGPGAVSKRRRRRRGLRSGGARLRLRRPLALHGGVGTGVHALGLPAEELRHRHRGGRHRRRHPCQMRDEQRLGAASVSLDGRALSTAQMLLQLPLEGVAVLGNGRLAKRLTWPHVCDLPLKMPRQLQKVVPGSGLLLAGPLEQHTALQLFEHLPIS